MKDNEKNLSNEAAESGLGSLNGQRSKKKS